MSSAECSFSLSSSLTECGIGHDAVNLVRDDGDPRPLQIFATRPALSSILYMCVRSLCFRSIEVVVRSSNEGLNTAAATQNMSNPLENFPNLLPEVQEQILNRPALDPPPGLVSNFDNPDNRNAAGYGIAIACFTVASISFIIRVYYRARVLRKWTAEDCMSVVQSVQANVVKFR